MTHENCTIVEYYRANSQLEISDLFKFIYQSCFGCEHLVSDYDSALNRIIGEAGSCVNDDLPGVEMLDGDFCRVHLKVFKTEEDLVQLCRVFIESSGLPSGGEDMLEEQLQLLLRYADEGLIGFDRDKLEAETNDWRKQGFPPIHHSDKFREAHHPAYRVVAKKYLPELNVVI